MDNNIENILSKLNITQLKSLIDLYGLEKPHSKSTKKDYINYLLSSTANLDAKMLTNYFSLGGNSQRPKAIKLQKEVSENRSKRSSSQKKIVKESKKKVKSASTKTTSKQNQHSDIDESEFIDDLSSILL